MTRGLESIGEFQRASESCARDGLSRRSALAGGAAATAASAFPAFGQAGGAVGQVTASMGAAVVARAGRRLPAGRGIDLFLDDLAMTGAASRLDMRLGAATRIRLGSNAALRIDRFSIGIVAGMRLQRGAALVERGSGAEPNFVLSSPFALLAARGTIFFAGPSRDVFGVFVREGAVEVLTRRGAVTLHAGQGTDIKVPGAPPTPVRNWSQKRIQAAFLSVS